MKFTKCIIVMTFLAVTTAESTGFTYDYKYNSYQTNCYSHTPYICNSSNNTICNNNS